MSLRLQLILLTTLVLLVSLITGGLLAYGYAQGKVQTEMRAAIAVGGRLARNALEEAGASPNPELELRRIVGEFDGDRHLRASWIDPFGHPVVSSQVANAPARPNLNLTLEIALEYIESDEFVEITPSKIRLRKKELSEEGRKRAERGGGKRVGVA